MLQKDLQKVFHAEIFWVKKVKKKEDFQVTNICPNGTISERYNIWPGDSMISMCF